MFKNLKLRTQLNLGFAVVIMLLVIVAGTAYWGLERAFEGFTEYRRLALASNQMNYFNEQMLHVRLANRAFILDPTEQNAQNFHNQFKEMQAKLTTLKERIKNPERAKRVVDLVDLTAQYSAAVTQMIATTQQRGETTKQLVGFGVAMQKSLQSLIDAAAADNKAEISAMGTRVLAQIQNCLLYTSFLNL